MGGARAEGAISFGGVGGPIRSCDKNVAREEKVELTCADGGGVEVEMKMERGGWRLQSRYRAITWRVLGMRAEVDNPEYTAADWLSRILTMSTTFSTHKTFPQALASKGTFLILAYK